MRNLVDDLKCYKLVKNANFSQISVKNIIIRLSKKVIKGLYK